MTRRRTVLGVLAIVGGVVVILVPAVVAMALLRAVLPDSDQARESAQAAADRVMPGQVQVLEARGRGEAGGYQITAQLVARPAVRFSWTGKRHCDLGMACEQVIRAATANARDGDAEHAALLRAFDSCGLPASSADVRHQSVDADTEPQTLAATVTVTIPIDQAPAATARLDHCVLTWGGQRAGLLAVERYRVRIALAGPDGGVHSMASVVIDNGQVRESAAANLRPALSDADERALLTALDAPIRTYLLQQGFGPARLSGLDAIYLPGTTQRLALTIYVIRTESDPSSPDTFRAVRLTVNPDGTAPTDLRLGPNR